MKKYLQASLLLFIAISATSQTTTASYYTAFDNSSQQAGWTGYRTGDLGAYNYTYVPNNAYSAPSCLYHDYPVGGSNETIDWFVSPAFDFSAGGKIDSIRTAFGGFGNPATDDTVAIVLLKGSPNPTLAVSKTLLHDFRGADYNNDGTWRKFSNITIPATAGPCYLAFQYRTIVNWLDIRYDNMAVTAIHTTTATGISIQAKDGEGIILFPNPAEKNTAVSISHGALQNEILTVKVFNILGALVLEKNISDAEKQFTLDQPAGTYVYQLSTTQGALLKTGKLLVH